MTDAAKNSYVRSLVLLVSLVFLFFFLERWVFAPVMEARLPEDNVKYWEEHARRNSGYPPSRIRLALAYTEVERLDEALHEFEAALKLQPHLDGAAIGRYGVTVAKGEKERALTALASYAQEHPGCGVCWQNLAFEYLDLGRLDAAATAVDALLASSFDVESGMYSVGNLRFEAGLIAGRVYAARGEHQRAIAHYSDAIREDPSDLRGYVLQAESLLASAQPNKALAVLDEARGRLETAENDRMQRRIQRLQAQARRAGTSR